ncbi:MAG TPA: DUF2127 domain-containing protein [Myxococcales bacterium]|nr:DUF2127 domain-containing protein [Myxococcales bacterium]
MRSRLWLRVIAVFKFVKAALFLAVVLGAYQMLHPATAARLQQWIEAVALRFDRRSARHVIAWVSGLRPNDVGVIAVGAFLYAALFMIEGTGLWTGKRWAEYLTVIATLSFVPFEIVEIVHRQSAPRISALIINLAVVAYLIFRLRSTRHEATA